MRVPGKESRPGVLWWMGRRVVVVCLQVKVLRARGRWSFVGMDVGVGEERKAYISLRSSGGREGKRAVGCDVAMAGCRMGVSVACCWIR